jgi:hypothetical protein
LRRYAVSSTSLRRQSVSSPSLRRRYDSSVERPWCAVSAACFIKRTHGLSINNARLWSERRHQDKIGFFAGQRQVNWTNPFKLIPLLTVPINLGL